MFTLRAEAILFDMDGTLVDSKAAVEKAWFFWSQRHSLILSEVLAYSHGRPTLATMEHFGKSLPPGTTWQTEADEMQQMEADMAGSVEIAGAGDLLTRLDNDRWAVVTSAPRLLAEKRMREAGLPAPRVLIPADEITRGKPDPEGFLKAAHTLGFRPDQCLVFEDTPPGVEAAKRAGIPVVGLLSTVAADRLDTPYLIRDFRQLELRATSPLIELWLSPLERVG